MAVRLILRMGNPILNRCAEEIIDPRAVHRLASDMADTLRHAEGAGLAAPQIGESVRLILFTVPAERIVEENDGETLDLQSLVNPRWWPLGEEREYGVEGCLSMPGLRGVVGRWRRIGYEGVDLQGRRCRRTASGFHARVVQHECDHLDGILFPQRMEDLTLLGYKEELSEALAAAACIRKDTGGHVR